MVNQKTIIEQQQDLEAQKAALKRKEKELKAREAAFLAEADARKNALLRRWGIAEAEKHEDEERKALRGISERLRGICEAYGCTLEELFEHIGSDTQINYFRRNRRS